MRFARRILVAASIAALGSMGVFTGAAVAAERLKLAVVEALSGPGSTTNRLFAIATKYWVDDVNARGGWNGRPIEYLEYDSQGSTSVAAEKAGAAIKDGAHIILQGGSSSIAGQITENVRKHNLRNPDRPVMYINPGSEALELTGSKCHFYFFRFATNAEMRVKAMVIAMKDAGDLGSKVFSINQNYSWGKDMETVTKAYQDLGGYQVVDAILHDVNKIQDFSPYVARISSSGANTVVTGNWGSDLLLLLKAVSAAGLDVQFGTMFLDLPGNVASAGEAALGYYTVQSFNAEAGGKGGRAIADAYEAKVGTAPTASEVRTLFALQMLEAALAEVKPGDKVDVTKIALAVENARIDTPIGKIIMRADDHQAIVPMVVARVSKEAAVKVDGTDMGFKPIKVIPGPEGVNAVQDSCKIKRPS